MTTVEELTRALQETRRELDEVRQRNTLLQTELERLKGRTGGLMGGPQLAPLSGPPAAPLGSPLAARPVAPLPSLGAKPAPATDSEEDSATPALADAFGSTGTDAELENVRHQLDELTKEKHEVEQRKWTIDKENIALKEQLNKLKVQGTNNMKIIEELVEKGDRKENQNFKTRLELTDLRKALSTARNEREKQEAANTQLHKECLELESEIMHYRALIDVETQRRDIIQTELNRQQDILGQYQSGFLARFYDK